MPRNKGNNQGPSRLRPFRKGIVMTDLMLYELRRIAGEGLIPALKEEAGKILGTNPVERRLEHHERAFKERPMVFRLLNGLGRFSWWKAQAWSIKLWTG
jgi:hypothetical protein